MEFKKTKIKDVIVVKLNKIVDSRGSFTETYKQNKLNDFLGMNINFCQENESYSRYGTLRGLHYQLPPFTQSKLVRVVYGSVLDIAVDIRIGSPTYAQYFAIELNDRNQYQLFVPRGFAHGYLVLSEEAIFSYKVDNYYQKKYERGIYFNDSELKINWQLDLDNLVLSDKDKNFCSLKNCKDLFDYKENLYV